MQAGSIDDMSFKGTIYHMIIWGYCEIILIDSFALSTTRSDEFFFSFFFFFSLRGSVDGFSPFLFFIIFILLF